VRVSTDPELSVSSSAKSIGGGAPDGDDTSDARSALLPGGEPAAQRRTIANTVHGGSRVRRSIIVKAAAIGLQSQSRARHCLRFDHNI